MTETAGAPQPAPVKFRTAMSGRRIFLIGVLVGALGFAAVMTAVSAFRGSTLATDAFLLKNKTGKGVVETASGLQYQVLTPGKGAKPTDSDVVLVNYEGKLLDGTTFDKSEQPTPFPVTGVVPGFAEGLKLMPKGAKYRFWIRPELGYGARASGPIPANSVLTFDVELVDFLPKAVIRQMQAQTARGTGGVTQQP